MRATRFQVVAAAAALVGGMASLAGCSGDGFKKYESGTVLGAVAGGVAGSTIGKGRGNVLATVGGAVVGGLIGGEIGRSLDERDRQLAQEAEFEALERGQSGVSRQWRNPDNGRYGDVVPSKPYKKGPSDCRDYTHTVYMNGRPQQMRGTACRGPDGSWQNVG